MFQDANWLVIEGDWEQTSPERAGVDPHRSQDAGPDGPISFDNSVYLLENTLLVERKIATSSALNKCNKNFSIPSSLWYHYRY